MGSHRSRIRPTLHDAWGDWWEEDSDGEPVPAIGPKVRAPVIASLEMPGDQVARWYRAMGARGNALLFDRQSAAAFDVTNARLRKGLAEQLAEQLLPGTPRYFRAWGRDVNVPEFPLTYDGEKRLYVAQGAGVDRRTLDEKGADALRTAIQAQPGLTTTELRKRLKLSGTKFRQVVAAAGDNLEIVKQGNTSRYYLADDEDKAA